MVTLGKTGVIRAHGPGEGARNPGTERAGEMNWVPASAEKVALVLDLPGPEGVLMGVALAGLGYQPVPLYNAVPLPFGGPHADDITGAEIAAVNVLPIVNALRMGAEQLAPLDVPFNAPPAFLLDANRRGDEQAMKPVDFDNRSISFTSDFPSANFLAAQGIQRVLLIQKDRLEPQSDLAHSLRRWQDGGFKLERLRLDLSSTPEAFKVARPPWYGAMFQRMLSSLGFRRAGGGGFGAWVPDSSAGVRSLFDGDGPSGRCCPPPSETSAKVVKQTRCHPERSAAESKDQFRRSASGDAELILRQAQDGDRLKRGLLQRSPSG